MGRPYISHVDHSIQPNPFSEATVQRVGVSTAGLVT